MTAPTWAVYYDDDSVFTSVDGAWNSAPADGVLFVLERIGDRMIVHQGADYYIRGWPDPSAAEVTVNPTGNLGPFLRKLGCVKFGRHVGPSTFERIGARAAEDAKRWARG